MVEKKKGSNRGLLIFLFLVAAIGVVLFIFRDELTNPIRGGGGKTDKKYPSIIKDGARRQGVRDRESNNGR